MEFGYWWNYLIGRLITNKIWVFTQILLASRLRLRLQKDFPELIFYRLKFRGKGYIVYLKNLKT